MNRKLLRSTLLTLSLGLMSSPAFATSLTGQQILEQFNLVVLGKATSASHVDGRTYVGGNLSGGDYVQHPNDTPASAYAGLTVKGNASGVTVNNYGAVVGGNLTNSTINSGNTVVLGTASGDAFNGGGQYYAGTVGSGNSNGTYNASLQTGTTATAATSTDFADVLNDLSGQLEALVSTGSRIATAYGTATFDAVADANGLAVFTINDSSFFTDAIKQYTFKLNGATTIIINSDVENVTLSANIIGVSGVNSVTDISSTILWNFYDAGTVTVKSQFGGSILATEATLTQLNNGANIEGGVYVNALDQRAEIHLQPFAGTLPSTPVPEPTTMLLFGAGLMSLTAVCRKK